MASINRIINYSSVRSGAGFAGGDTSTLMIVDAHNKFPERVRFYTSVAGMLSDGFLSTDAAVLAASAAFKQRPKVSRVGVGRRAATVDIDYQIVPTAFNSTLYTVNITNPAGVSFVASFTSAVAATVANICTGVTAAITALSIPGLTVTDQTTSVRLKSTVAGQWFSVSTGDIARLNVYQNQLGGTIAADLTADLNAIIAEKRDWAAFVLTTSSEVELLAAANWAQLNNRMFGGMSSDLRPANNVAGTYLKQLRTAAQEAVSGHVHHVPSEFAAAALLSDRLARPVGSVTFANTPLIGITPTPFTETQLSNLDNDRGNYYTSYDVNNNSNETIALANTGVTMGSANGTPIFIDSVRDLMAFENEVKAALLARLVQTPKVPYSAKGQTLLATVLRVPCLQYAALGVIEDTFVVSNVPLASIPAGDKGVRYMPGFEIEAELSGAVHRIGVLLRIVN
jgi:hypothetical protein